MRKFIDDLSPPGFASHSKILVRRKSNNSKAAKTCSLNTPRETLPEN